jgi:MFS family permease
MESTDRGNPEQMASTKTVAGVSLLDTTIERYDFFICITAAPIVFNQLFFSEFEPLVGTLLSYSVNAVAFLTRPIGGALFGHFGDRIGRSLRTASE